MNERDRKVGEAAKEFGNDEPGRWLRELFYIIDRLDKQLTEIREAAVPIGTFAAQLGSDKPGDYIISVAGVHHSRGSVCLVVDDLRRLVGALKEE